MLNIDAGIGLLEKKLSPWMTVDALPELFVVGGCVRDLMLGRTFNDIDLVCENAEETAKKIAIHANAAFVPLGEQKFLPCFRVVDRKKVDNFIDIAPMWGGSIEADLSRRDFTVNAIAICMEKGGKCCQIIDPEKGMNDLKTKTIRMVRDDVFENDPVRLLRAVRFAAELGFSIDEETRRGMETCKELIQKTAGERILYEIIRIFRTPRAFQSVELMDAIGLIDTLIPEFIPSKGCIQNGYHHLDVWNHSLAVLERMETILKNPEEHFGHYAEKVMAYFSEKKRLPMIKIAALLHDIGKPAAKGIHPETGHRTFYGHNKTGKEIVNGVMRRLCAANEDRNYILKIVAGHMRILDMNRPGVKRSTLLNWIRETGEDIISILVHGLADIHSIRGPMATAEFRRNHREWSKRMIGEYFNSLKDISREKNIIDGRDLLSIGVSQGPDIGSILKKIREAVDDGEIRTKEDALRYASRLMRDIDSGTGT